ncbi:F-type H+-transporting ATPase subunit gamma [Lachnospiraceae bacterium KH1T2]|jgi:F-type H+-transporting ATPase subunit gamma|nr:F-type H+-transporting ATPase subunit gamma [Lachnospiraceae bacterium KH1T2]
MANTKEIKDRINSIKQTQKITNAMYLISSTKLQKARKDLEATEPYFFGMEAMVDRLRRHLPDIENPYFETFDELPEDEKVYAYLVITADKGLAGSYNHNVLKMTEEAMSKHKNTKLFVVGELGRQYFESKHIQIDEQFHYTAQNPSLHRARMISLRMLELFTKREIHSLNIVYTFMVNSMATENVNQVLLPLKASVPDVSLPMDVYQEEFMLEPSPDAVINAVVPNCTTGYIYSALVESFCSEQNARMQAMQAANKSANEILHDLSIQYNRVRQAMITQEITEVCAGAKAAQKD